MTEVSVVLPMYNEEENAENTIREIIKVLEKNYSSFEVVVVNDGSTDSTGEIIEKISKKDPRVRFLNHSRNLGKGNVYRTAFPHLKGDFVVTIDADLSYSPSEIPSLIENLKNKNVEIVLGSPYTKGGRAENVPFFRLLISKIGNRILGFSLGADLHCVTGIFRAYRRDVIQSIYLESNGKEVEPEIISKSISMGYKILEVPATLKRRVRGKSSFKLKKVMFPHLMLSFLYRPMILFGILGIIFTLLGLLSGFYIIYLWTEQALNPERPLMILCAMFIIVGVQMFAFGFISTQNTILVSEIHRLQSDILRLKREK